LCSTEQRNPFISSACTNMIITGDVLDETMVKSCVCTNMIITGDVWDETMDKSYAKMLFGLPLPSVVCRRAHVLFMLFVFAYSRNGHN
jgi:hypothetical protein